MATNNYFRIWITLGFFCWIGLPVNAQRIVNIGFQLNPGMTWLQSRAPEGLSGFSKEGNFPINFGLSGHYYLNKKIAFYTGIQMYAYSFHYTGKEYNVRFQTFDSENKPYQRIVSGTDITEKTSLQTLNLPLCVMYEYALNRNIQLFGLAGPVLSFPVQKKIKASGTFTYKGYYEDGNYTLENIPVYGFNSNVPVAVDENLKTHFVFVSGTVSAGAAFVVNRYLKFFVSASYIRTLTSPVKRESDQYYISNELGSFHTILENSKSSLNTISIGVGFQKVILF